MHAGRLGSELYVGETQVPLKKLTPGTEEKMDRVLEKLTLVRSSMSNVLNEINYVFFCRNRRIL